MENIAFYCSSISWGGLEMNFVRFANRLKNRKFNIIVYCIEGSPIADNLKTTQLDVVYVNRNKKYYDIVNALKVKKQFKKDNIKAVWIRDTRDISLVGLVKTLTGNSIKIIYQQAMQIGVKKKDFLHTLRFSKIDAWISLLQFLSNQVKEFTSFDSTKNHIIPLAVEINSENRITKLEAQQFFNLKSNKFIIGIIGRLSIQKGQHFLIEQIAALKQQNIDVELLIVGEDTQGEGDSFKNLLNELILKHNLKADVHFFPFMTNVELFYKAVDVFAMTSKGETFGNVTIEAMVYGTPIIGTNSSGTPEILDYGKLGNLYEVGNGTDFCNQIKWMINHPEDVKKRTLKAQQIAKHKYSVDVVCNQIENVLTVLNLNACKS